MVDAGDVWSCAACGAPTAGYRRRCLDCGARRPAGDVATAPPPPAAVAPGGGHDGPRRRSAGRAAAVVAVLAMAVYGAVTYFGAADPPSEEDDLAALRAAVDGGAVVGGGAVLLASTESGGGVRAPLLPGPSTAVDRPGCTAAEAADLGRREDQLLYDGGETPAAHLRHRYQGLDGSEVTVALSAFRTDGLARTYESLLTGEDARRCAVALDPAEVRRVGRAVLTVQGGADPAPILDRLEAGLEVEG